MGNRAQEQGKRSDPVQVLNNSGTIVPECANLGKPKAAGHVGGAPKMTRNQKQGNQSNHKSCFKFGLSEGENSRDIYSKHPPSKVQEHLEKEAGRQYTSGEGQSEAGASGQVRTSNSQRSGCLNKAKVVNKTVQGGRSSQAPPRAEEALTADAGREGRVGFKTIAPGKLTVLHKMAPRAGVHGIQ